MNIRYPIYEGVYRILTSKGCFWIGRIRIYLLKYLKINSL